jgi:hypothetical protein
VPPAAVNTAEGFSELARVWCQSWADLIFVGEDREVLGLLERSNEEEGLEGEKQKKPSSMGNDKSSERSYRDPHWPASAWGVKAHFNSNGFVFENRRGKGEICLPSRVEITAPKTNAMHMR